MIFNKNKEHSTRLKEEISCFNFQVGDEVSALWPPDGKHYPAVVVEQQKGLQITEI